MRASISSQVLYTATEARTVLSPPKRRKVGWTQWWPARTAIPSASSTLPTSSVRNPSRTNEMKPAFSRTMPMRRRPRTVVMGIVEHPDGSPLILLTGGTGYIGGRLLKALEASGRPVRCLARRPHLLQARVGPGTEVVAGDCLDCSTLMPSMAGGHTAYYLIHSIGSPRGFEEEDRQAAKNFANAACQAGVQRIIYLGGLGDPSSELSSHLRSRQEVGGILRSSNIRVIEFRASIILGSGSLSFEMIRALVGRLPVMICPRWFSTPAQPIAIEDVVAYLIEALSLPAMESRVFEIGGADQDSYADIMCEYARQRDLHRWIISVPVLTPRLSSLWLGLVTPLYARVGRKLVDSLRHPTVVRDASAMRMFRVFGHGDYATPWKGLYITKIANLRKPNGRTPYRPLAACSREVAYLLAPDFWIRGSFRSRFRPRWHSHRSCVLGETPAGTSPTFCGDCAASSTCLPVVWDCGEVGEIRKHFKWVMPWISGAWKSSMPGGSCASSPK
jgi:uncharacterized protein YbjT (DUF2867 family)